MAISLIALHFVLAAVLGCGVAWADLPIGDTDNLTLTSQSLTRRYDVHVPVGYVAGTPTPLVIDLHGYSVDGQLQASISGLKSRSDSAGFIVAWPWGYDGGDPVQRSWNAGTCCPPATTAGLDDVAFLRAVVADLSTRVAVDPQRVYGTGLSNGGAMAFRLACDAADLFAAVVSVSGPLFFDPFTTCVPARPMPVLHFAGLTDQVVPYTGGPTLVFPSIIVQSAADTFAYWAQTDGCDGGTTVENLPNGATCETHPACNGGVMTELCSIHGSQQGVLLGHVLYFNDDGVDVAQRSWAFLSQFTLPSGVTTTTTSIATTTTSTSTTTTLPCGTTPQPDCRLAAAGGAAVHVRSDTDPTKSALDWIWGNGAATAVTDFLDPVNGSAAYHFCVYDGSTSPQPLLDATVPAGGLCGTKSCWKATGTKGFKLVRKDGTPQGVTGATLTAGVPGKARVRVTAKGAHLMTPALPLTLPVTVQLVAGEGMVTNCWQTTYTRQTLNDLSRFKAKGP